MIFGWSLLVIAVVITASLCYSFTRIMVAEHRRMPRRPRERLSTRARRLSRIVIEPVLGR